MKRSLSPSPCPWQNFPRSQWEQDYPANISVTNRASLKSIFWHWWESFITMDCCKLRWGVSSSLPSSLSVSSSNRAADGHTRDRAGKRWEMLFHWQLVTRRVCICFCLLPMKYYGSECAIKELEPSAVKSKNILQELQGHWKNPPFLSLWNGTPGQLCSRTDPSSLALREAGSLAGVLLALLKASVWLGQADEPSRLLFSCSWSLILLNLPLLPAGE